MDNKNNIPEGVINEQGYVVGQFGFKPLTEAEKAKLENDEDDDE